MDIARRLEATKLRVRRRSPFFATLMLFANYYEDKHIPTAATDGKAIYYNPIYLESLSKASLDGLMLHELLHIALLHLPRRQERELLLWNVACDIVINGMLAQENWLELPKGALRDEALENLSAEEVYILLQERSIKLSLPHGDLLILGDGPMSEAERSELSAHWKHALAQAVAVQRSSKGQGDLPTGLKRLLGEVLEPQLDWRVVLWRFLSRTPVDYQGFDRRFIHEDLYLEHLEGESVEVLVCIDTSGSISDAQLGQFYSELQGIIRAYPNIYCQLYFADAGLYGPYKIDSGTMPPKPEGGGGTSFKPFFTAVQAKHQDATLGESILCVYLTDGYGDFPQEAPQLPVLWVVTLGGADSKSFPFGEVARLI